MTLSMVLCLPILRQVVCSCMFVISNRQITPASGSVIASSQSGCVFFNSISMLVNKLGTKCILKVSCLAVSLFSSDSKLHSNIDVIFYWYG